MNSYDLMQHIIRLRGIQDAKMFLYFHSAQKNWRQIYLSVEEKVNNIDKTGIFDTYNPVEVKGHELLMKDITDFISLKELPLLSVSSQFYLDEVEYHLGIMNLHPAEEMNFDQLKLALMKLINDEFWLVKTDRYYHVYTSKILSKEDWIKWNLRFLMSDCLVSPGYMGHSLERGFNLLRLNSEKGIKKIKPIVIYYNEAINI